MKIDHGMVLPAALLLSLMAGIASCGSCASTKNAQDVGAKLVYKHPARIELLQSQIKNLKETSDAFIPEFAPIGTREYNILKSKKDDIGLSWYEQIQLSALYDQIHEEQNKIILLQNKLNDEYEHYTIVFPSNYSEQDLKNANEAQETMGGWFFFVCLFCLLVSFWAWAHMNTKRTLIDAAIFGEEKTNK